MESTQIKVRDERIVAEDSVKRIRYRRWKPVVILMAAAASIFGGVSPALATSDTGNQNPDFTVYVSLASRGTPDLDVATNGDTVDVVLSVRDNKPFAFRTDEVKLNITLQTPFAPFTVSLTVYLFPGTSVTLPFSYTVNEYFPRGPYALTLEAIEVADPAAPPSTATATITLI
jgi:hypothetical protein